MLDKAKSLATLTHQSGLALQELKDACNQVGRLAHAPVHSPARSPAHSPAHAPACSAHAHAPTNPKGPMTGLKLKGVKPMTNQEEARMSSRHKTVFRAYEVVLSHKAVR